MGCTVRVSNLGKGRRFFSSLAVQWLRSERGVYHSHVSSAELMKLYLYTFTFTFTFYLSRPINVFRHILILLSLLMLSKPLGVGRLLCWVYR